ncbi:MAG: phage holin family protein [Pseudomonadota bacterium]
MSLHAQNEQSESVGLAASLRRLGGTFCGVLHTRGELFTRELERERLQLTRLLLLAVGALFFVSLGALTLTLFIIVLFWDSHRLMAIGMLTGVYLMVGIGFGLSARRAAARRARPFAATLAQLKKDREHFAHR